MNFNVTHIIIRTVPALLIGLMVILPVNLLQTDPDKDHLSSFVEVQNGSFSLEGDTFRFVGTNAYYLPNYKKLDPEVVERAFSAFNLAGITVVRMWAFYDGFDCGYSAQDDKENVIQLTPGVYNEEALEHLDYIIARGKQQNIRFILPFINYWDELGGICQYNTWAGAENPSQNMEFFLTNYKTQKWFKDYISMLLNRVNTYTGVAYKDEPAILSWQIMNEGRNKGQDPKILRDWYREMAQYIKSIDPNHLVGTGEEGFDENVPPDYSKNKYSNTYALRANEGTSYVMNTAIPEIDYGNAHWYPTEYGFGHSVNERFLRAQEAWLSDHKKIAANFNKPFILGEYGYPGWGDERVVAMYTNLWRTAEEINLEGSLFWQLTADYVKCSEYGGNICWPGGREDTQLFMDFRKHLENVQYPRHVQN
ncbi:MAG: cellulase family glycosylhydrolase [Balneolaceae bacterium]